MQLHTGLYSATSGTAIINGYDINTNIEKIRGSLGLCPQHNMLFPSLTVTEHLRFFGMVMQVMVFFFANPTGFLWPMDKS